MPVVSRQAPSRSVGIAASAPARRRSTAMSVDISRPAHAITVTAPCTAGGLPDFSGLAVCSSRRRGREVAALLAQASRAGRRARRTLTTSTSWFELSRAAVVKVVMTVPPMPHAFRIRKRTASAGSALPRDQVTGSMASPGQGTFHGAAQPGLSDRHCDGTGCAQHATRKRRSDASQARLCLSHDRHYSPASRCRHVHEVDGRVPIGEPSVLARGERAGLPTGTVPVRRSTPRLDRHSSRPRPTRPQRSARPARSGPPSRPRRGGGQPERNRPHGAPRAVG